ncbi:MAG: SUMF1/EgtB/PvdO family nonheme iron enzyme [Armatimonadia bacterium]
MTALLELLRVGSPVWIATLVRASVEGGVALLVVWGLCRMWPKMPPALGPWLWRLACAKLLLALVCMPVAVPVLPRAVGVAAQTAAPQEGGASQRVVAGAVSTVLVRAPAVVETLRVPRGQLLLASSPDLRGWLLLTWLAGVLLSVARLVYGWLLLRRIRAKTQRSQDPSVAALLAEWCARLGLRRTPEFGVSDRLGPLLLGVCRPMVIMPVSLLADGTEAQVSVIAGHELAHLRRRDLHWVWLPTLAEVLFFFHPLVWLARRELTLAQEIACDALVLSARTASPATYAHTLTWVLRHHRAKVNSGLAVAGIGESTASITRRLVAMQHFGVVRGRLATAVTVLAIVVGTVGLVDWHPEARAAGSAPGPGAQAVGARLWQHPGSKAGDQVVGPDGGKLVWVPPGEFMMGTAGEPAGDLTDGYAHERPVHRVRITKGFWLGRCTVTNAQYRRFCEETGEAFPTLLNEDGSASQERDLGDDHPVMFVTWNGAAAYCARYGLRLPTEAEWEYAARGTAGYVWPWGNEWDNGKCCNKENPGPGGRTFPVGSFPAGARWCGAMDMAGNVYQWCQDWFAADYYSHSPTDDPQGPNAPEPDNCRVQRGGSFGNLHLGYSSFRTGAPPLANGTVRGFRCAVSPE